MKNNLEDSSRVKLTREDALGTLEGAIELLDPLKGKHLFITGGSGFLGLWLLELIAVLNGDHAFKLRVTVLSRRANDRLRYWPHLAESDWLQVLDGDVRYLDGIPHDVNYVIHAAAISDRRLCASEPTAVAEVNSHGTIRTLRAASLLDGLEKFLLVSSGLVYGEITDSEKPVSEEQTGVVRHDSAHQVYAESKRMAEMFVHAAISEYKLPLVITRPFAFVGPYLSLSLPWAATDFIRDSFNGGPIRIMGDGSTVRSLMYGSEFALWTLVALLRGREREAYNIGSPYGIGLLQLAQEVSSLFVPSPEILTKIGKVSRPSVIVPSTEKIQSEFGLRIHNDLKSSLVKTIEWNRTGDSKFN